MMLALIAAALASGLVGDLVDTAAIRVIVLRNGFDIEIGQVAALLHCNPSQSTPLQRRYQAAAKRRESVIAFWCLPCSIF